MQKKLIALAVAGIMAAPMAAQAASAEVYGKVRVSVDFVDDGATAAATESSAMSVTSHSSRFGVKGSEDLDGGLKAVYQFESQVDFDDDNNGLFDSMRNTYVGLGGDFGTVLLGRHDTPYKMATGKLDVFGDTVADYNAVIAHDTRADNVIAYLAPDMGAMSLAVAYVPNYVDDNLPMTTAGSETDAVSLMGAYNADGLGVSLAYESLGTATDSMDSTKLGVSYEMDMTTVGFIYQNNEMGSSMDQDVIYVSAKHKMDDLTLKAAVGSVGESTDGADDGGTMVALGVAKSYSKNVELYALYASMSNDDGGMNGLKTVDAAVAGESASALSAGINLKFSSM